MMICRKIIFVFLVGFLLFDASESNAQRKMRSRNPYLITNIFSSAEEGAPSESRAAATIKANRIAFLVLLKNLGIDESFKDQVSDEQIADAVYSRQITDERIAGNYYSAKFNISFLKSTVNSILDNEDAQEVVREGEEVFLLFPVEIYKGKPILWERNNSWRNALEEAISYSNIRNIILPRGDYLDIVKVNTKNLEYAQYPEYAAMLSRYGADKAIVAYFDFDKIENKANIILKTISGRQDSKTRLSFVNSKNLSRIGLITRVADRTINHIANSNESKITKLRLRSASSSEMPLNIEISDLEEWMMIKGRVETMHFVKKMQLESMSRNIVKVTIKHSSDPENIVRLFSQNGFILRKGRNEEYYLSLK